MSERIAETVQCLLWLAIIPAALLVGLRHGLGYFDPSNALGPADAARDCAALLAGLALASAVRGVAALQREASRRP